MSAPKERAKRGTLSHMFVCLLVCVSAYVCDGRVRFPQMFPLTFDPTVGGQALTNEMVEFWPEPQTFHNNLLSSSSASLSSYPSFLTPSLLAVFLFHDTQRVGESSRCKQTCFIVFAVGISKHTPFQLRVTT